MLKQVGSSSTRVTGYVHSLRVSPHNIFFIKYGGENSNFILADTTLTKWSKLTLPVMEQTDTSIYDTLRTHQFCGIPAKSETIMRKYQTTWI